MASILIIGSRSTVGHALGQYLASEHEVVYAGRKEAQIYLDLAADEDLPIPQRTFDIVINAAAHFGGNDVNDLLMAEKVNALGALRVSELANQVGAQKLIQISSASANYKQNDPYFGIYALSKRHGDELAQLYCLQHGIAFAVLRPSQLYDDASECRKHQGLFYSIIDRAALGQNITIYGSNDSKRNLLFLSDFCEIVRRVIDRKLDGIFNCAYPNSTTISEIANTAFSVFAKGGKLTFDRTKPDIPDLPEFASDLLFDELSYYPQTDLFRGITMIKRMRSNL